MNARNFFRFFIFSLIFIFSTGCAGLFRGKGVQDVDLTYTQDAYESVVVDSVWTEQVKIGVDTTGTPIYEPVTHTIKVRKNIKKPGTGYSLKIRSNGWTKQRLTEAIGASLPGSSENQPANPHNSAAANTPNTTPDAVYKHRSTGLMFEKKGELWRVHGQGQYQPAWIPFSTLGILRAQGSAQKNAQEVQRIIREEMVLQ